MKPQVSVFRFRLQFSFRLCLIIYQEKMSYVNWLALLLLCVFSAENVPASLVMANEQAVEFLSSIGELLTWVVLLVIIATKEVSCCFDVHPACYESYQLFKLPFSTGEYNNQQSALTKWHQSSLEVIETITVSEITRVH